MRYPFENWATKPCFTLVATQLSYYVAQIRARMMMTMMMHEIADRNDICICAIDRPTF